MAVPFHTPLVTVPTLNVLMLAVLLTSRFDDMEALLSKNTKPSTSNLPLINTSFDVDSPRPVAFIPKRLYEVDVYPPTCIVLPVNMYDALAVPCTSSFVVGVAVPMPSLLFVSSQKKFVLS